MTSSNRKKLIMLTHGTLATVFSEDDVTDVLAWDWWRASSANLRQIFGKIVGKRRQGFGKGRQGKEEKKREGGDGKKERREG